MRKKKANTRINTTVEQDRTIQRSKPRLTRVANPKRPPRKPPDNLSNSEKPDNPPKAANSKDK